MTRPGSGDAAERLTAEDQRMLWPDVWPTLVRWPPRQRELQETGRRFRTEAVREVTGSPAAHLVPQPGSGWVLPA